MKRTVAETAAVETTLAIAIAIAVFVIPNEITDQCSPAESK